MTRRDATPVAAADWSWLAAWPDHYPMPGKPGDLADWYVCGYDFALTVYGRPAPQGSKTHKGKGRMVESSEAVKPWREAVRSDAVAMIATLDGFTTLDGPLAVRMIFTMPAPLTARPGDRPAKIPDQSKLVRSTEDALKDAGLIRGDQLFVEYDRVAKVYPRWDPESLDRPGAVVKIRRLT